MDERILAHPAPPSGTKKPKTVPCSGCGRKHPHQELIELHEDNHDDLTYFHGDRVCKPCARGNGVSY